MNARTAAENLFKPESRMEHWESELGKKILEGYLLKSGIADARVISVKNLIVTLQSTASGKAIFDAEASVRRKYGQLFELMMARKGDDSKLRIKLVAMRGVGGAT